MIKKVIVGTGVALLLGLLCFGWDAASYLRTSVGYVKESVTDSVPMEFQIDRAREMIQGLTKSIKDNRHVIAVEESKVERLEKRIADAEKLLDKQKTEMMRLRNDLEKGEQMYTYSGREYTADQVKTDLANRFERYKTSDATLESLRDIRQARIRSLDAARNKFEGMLATKRQLTVEVENLEARMQMVAAAETTSEYQFDDSELGHVKELVSDLRTRLEVAERMVNVEGYVSDGIQLDATTPEDIVTQLTEYFGESKPSTDSIAITE